MADKTAAQIKAEKEATNKAWRAYVSNYQATYGLKNEPPAALKKQFDAKYLKGGWTPAWADEWVRVHDKNYSNSTQYKTYETQLVDMYKNSYGYDYKLTKADQSAIKLYSRRPYTDAGTAARNGNAYFLKNIASSAAFKARNPGFTDWLSKNTRYAPDVAGGLGVYRAVYDSFLTPWQEAGMTGEVPADIMEQAMRNNWDPTGNLFKSAIVNHPAYNRTQSYADRVTDFQKQWAAIMPAGFTADATLMDKYAKSPKGWDDFLRDEISTSKTFQDAYPDYAAWEERQHKLGGELNAEGQVTIQDYFQTRSQYADLWAEEYTDGTPIDPNLITQAMAGNWSATVFKNYLRKLPSYQGTPEAQNKRASFETYWRGMFGDTAPVDEALAAKYTQGDFVNTDAMWDDVKQSALFQSQFPNWNEYSASQAAAGNNVTDDPMAYKEYQTAFYKAFSDIGMQVPAGMDRQIFSSGLDARDIQTNAEDFSKTQNSYSWQSGQQADIGQAIGLGDKASGGDLRQRMAQALEQHRAYTSSKFNSFDTQNKNDQLIKKI
jgi:hypothetical protein